MKGFISSCPYMKRTPSLILHSLKSLIKLNTVFSHSWDFLFCLYIIKALPSVNSPAYSTLLGHKCLLLKYVSVSISLWTSLPILWFQMPFTCWWFPNIYLQYKVYPWVPSWHVHLDVSQIQTNQKTNLSSLNLNLLFLLFYLSEKWHLLNH